ncbi:type II toxin-antitoxin system RelE/ParE family toxin [Levilactobacillus yonginensis]|uniref:type II toxin-antitoxin system RelE/ParE family toxin n=1 Tax=Levilactobacillus yonginensis TaxID=1054041 RepID=UPI000F7A94AE|nr:type II toxin-antitoxin system RelE/ParE family toxin [Levilactobacillus yonginensis]
MIFDYYDWHEFSRFLDALPNQDAAKLTELILKIETYGLYTAERQRWTRKLADNLFEIRSRQRNNTQRVIYFHLEGNRYVITHGFTKKSVKTPRNEIAKGQYRKQLTFNKRRPPHDQ